MTKLLPPSLSSSCSVVILSLLVHAIAAILPARQSNNPLADDFFSQNDQMDVPELSDSPASKPEPRLLDILQLRRVITDIANDPDLGKPLEDMQTTENSDLMAAAPKRLFCNNYTGCGGRFRGRRRMLQRGKRPFCNHYGCLNGRKRHTEPAKTEQRIEVPLKRLFCNSYGGCQNFGKRLATSKAVGGETEIDLFSKVEEQSKSKLKRFLNGGYDRSMQSLLGNLRR